MKFRNGYYKLSVFNTRNKDFLRQKMIKSRLEYSSMTLTRDFEFVSSTIPTGQTGEVKFSAKVNPDQILLGAGTNIGDNWVIQKQKYSFYRVERVFVEYIPISGLNSQSVSGIAPDRCLFVMFNPEETMAANPTADFNLNRNTKRVSMLEYFSLGTPAYLVSQYSQDSRTSNIYSSACFIDTSFPIAQGAFHFWSPGWPENSVIPSFTLKIGMTILFKDKKFKEPTP